MCTTPALPQRVLLLDPAALPPCPCCSGELVVSDDDGDRMELLCLDCVRWTPTETDD